MPEIELFGSMTALVTPFDEKGNIDHSAYQKMVKWQLDEGTHGFVPCGTTGEAPTLIDQEPELLTRLCAEVVKGKAPILAGCGSNSTQHAINLTHKVQKAGADAALQVVPYYNKPSQEGLYQHFKAIHDQTELPIVIYNIPGRSVVDMSVETMARLAALPRIIGVKDATGDLGRPVKTAKECGTDFMQFSGNDDTALAFLTQGGVGCISVLSNVVPGLCSKMHEAFHRGALKEAQEINIKLQDLSEALFAETSPAPAKACLSMMGLIQNNLRLPMIPVTKGMEARLESILQSLDVLETKAA